MELYGTTTSPYTRVARIIAMELGHDIPLHPMKWRETPDDLYDLNPAGRIPVLVDGERRVTESRTISAYLLAHPESCPTPDFRRPDGPLRWEEEHLLGILYAAIDSVALISFLDEPPPRLHSYIDRCRERLDKCFRALDQAAAPGYLIEPVGFGMAEAGLITIMDFVDGRALADINPHRNAQTIRARFAERPSVRETAPVF